MGKRTIGTGKPNLCSFTEYTSKIKSIWENGWLTNSGPIHQEFTQALKEYLKIDHLELFVNGHSALYAGLMALGLPKDGEVITTPFTFASTIHAIIQCGLRPVFCDIREDTCCIDERKIEELINPNTCAVLGVHLFGNTCKVKEIQQIVEKYKIKVIYDGAQAFGSTVEGESVGHFGDICMFSMHATKVYNSIEGGILTFQEESLGEQLSTVRNFGIQRLDGDTMVTGLGFNGKMDEFRAAMGLLNLPLVDGEIAARKSIAQRYRNEIENIEGLSGFNQSEGTNYSYFSLIVDEEVYGKTRDDLWLELKERGISARRLYAQLANQYVSSSRSGELMTAEKLSRTILDIPIYSGMNEDDISYVCDCLKRG